MMGCLILLSGGQDSCTCLAWACNEFNNIHSISFHYSQRHEIELDRAKELSKIAGCKSHIVVPVTSLPFFQSSSALFKNSESDIMNQHHLNPDLPASFVPGRNYIFLGLAAIRAYQLGIKDIVCGVCQTDYSGYPDCREYSIVAVEDALKKCMDFDFVIHTPLMHRTKKEIVEMMKELGKLHWYRSTHTCYNGKYPPCGSCPSCELRAKGFSESGIKDPLLGDYK